MLSITTRGQYGMRALLELAMHFDQGVLQVQEISQRGAIPKTYLEQLFNGLRKAGLVSSVRGKRGGYRLAKSPSQIRLGDVLHTLEGGNTLDQNYLQDDAIKGVLQKAQQALNKVFEVTLEELVRQQQKRNKQLTFYI